MYDRTYEAGGSAEAQLPHLEVGVLPHVHGIQSLRLHQEYFGEDQGRMNGVPRPLTDVFRYRDDPEDASIWLESKVIQVEVPEREKRGF